MRARCSFDLLTIRYPLSACTDAPTQNDVIIRYLGILLIVFIMEFAAAHQGFPSLPCPHRASPVPRNNRKIARNKTRAFTLFAEVGKRQRMGFQTREKDGKDITLRET
jgi:hypothetical protein